MIDPNVHAAAVDDAERQSKRAFIAEKELAEMAEEVLRLRAWMWKVHWDAHLGGDVEDYSARALRGEKCPFEQHVAKAMSGEVPEDPNK